MGGSDGARVEGRNDVRKGAGGRVEAGRVEGGRVKGRRDGS